MRSCPPLGSLSYHGIGKREGKNFRMTVYYRFSWSVMRIQKKGKEPAEDEIVPKMYTEGTEVLAQPFLTRSSGLKGQVQGLCMRPPLNK